MVKKPFQEWLEAMEKKGVGEKSFLADPYWWSKNIGRPLDGIVAVTADSNLRIGVRIKNIPCLVFATIPNPTEAPSSLLFFIRRGDQDQAIKPEQALFVEHATGETVIAAIRLLIEQQAAMM